MYGYSTSTVADQTTQTLSTFKQATMYFGEENCDDDIYCEAASCNQPACTTRTSNAYGIIGTQFYPALSTLTKHHPQWLTPQTLVPSSTPPQLKNAPNFEKKKTAKERYMPISNKALITLCIGISGIVFGLLGLLAYSMFQIPPVRRSLGKTKDQIR